MQEDFYIMALKHIDGLLWQLIGALEADKVRNSQQQEETMFEEDKTTDKGIVLRTLKQKQGTITKRTRKTSKGTYTYYQGKYTKDGVTYYVTAPTENECYAKLANVRANNKEKRNTALTLQQWLEQYLRVYKQNKVVQSTVTDYQRCIDNLIPQKLKQTAIAKIKAVDIQQVVNDIAKTRPRRARTVYDIFNGALKQAWNNDIISKDIAKGLQRPVVNSKEETPLTPEQQQALMHTSNKVMREVLTAYIYSGCRFTELLTLRCEYYNKDEKTLFINGTKTKTSKRTIPVFPPLKEILDKHTDGEYIFDVSAKTLKRHKAMVEKEVGFKFTFKSLRHTFNQNMTEIGIPDIVRAGWLGHSKPTTTKKTYTHMTKSLEQQSIDMVINSLNNGKN